MFPALFVIITIGISQQSAGAALNQVDDGVCAVQMMVEKHDAEKVMPATGTAPTLSCPTTAKIYNYDLSFDYQLLYTSGVVSGATFTYTLTTSSNPAHAWLDLMKFWWWLPNCPCSTADETLVEVNGMSETPLGFKTVCDLGKFARDPTFFEFKDIDDGFQQGTFKAQWTLHSSDFMINGIFMMMFPDGHTGIPYNATICGPVCGFDLQCVDEPNPWMGEAPGVGGDGCAAYSFGGLCTEYGYGFYWDLARTGVFSDFADGGGVAANEACCVCGGGSSCQECRDSPQDWIDTFGEACDVFLVREYCNPDGTPGPGWDVDEFGPLEGAVDDNGVPVTEACCVCGGGQKQTCSPTPMPTPAPTGDSASSFGDPHVGNLKGEKFDILAPDYHNFLVVPRGAAKKNASLYVLAKVDPRGALCDGFLYVTSLIFTGEWLGNLSRLEFSTKIDGAMDGESAMKIRVGTSASYLNVTQFQAGVPKTLAEVATYRPKTPQSLNQHVTTLEVKLRLGPSVSKVRMVYQKEKSGWSNSLWLTTTGLQHIQEEIGGILGLDDHRHAASAPEECLSSARLRKGRQPGGRGKIHAALLASNEEKETVE